MSTGAVKGQPTKVQSQALSDSFVLLEERDDSNFSTIALMDLFDERDTPVCLWWLLTLVQPFYNAVPRPALIARQS